MYQCEKYFKKIKETIKFLLKSVFLATNIDKSPAYFVKFDHNIKDFTRSFHALARAIQS